MVDVLNTHQEQPPEDPNYVKEMVEKAEGLNNTSEERPEWLPEKFKSPQDMADAYSNLEKQFHQQSEPDEEAESSVDDMETEEVQEFLNENGIDFDTMSNTFWEEGGLSDNDYDTLEKAGIPSDVVDQFIDGQMAIMESTRQQAFNTVGSEEGYNDMMQWASTSLSEAEQDAFNSAVDSGDMGTAMFAIQGLAARYRSEAGVEPNLVGGEASSNSVGAFNSLAELTSAMSDPRYEKDSAYRDQVARRLQQSSVL
jgi:hypothetical protein